jgi:membrane-associated phospholipid phosphatase
MGRVTLLGMTKELPLTEPIDHTHAPTPQIRWARVVSDLISPPVVWAVLAFPIAARADADPQRALLWAAIYVVLVCIVPVVFIALMVQRGHITDIHIKVRRQRIIPFIVSIVCTAFCFAILLMLQAPLLIRLFALFSLLQIVVMLIVTTRWQISMHAMASSGAVVAVFALFGGFAGLLFSPVIALVGAARIVLKRHTLAQVIAGAFVGGISTALLFFVVLPRVG